MRSEGGKKLIITIVLFSVLIPCITSADFELSEENNLCGLEAVECASEPKPVDMKQWVMNELKASGIDYKTAEKIIQCESGWNPSASNTANRNGSSDLGLWQINSIHSEISVAQKLDYKAATRWAIKKIKHDGNFSAWVCSDLIQ